MSIRHKIVDFAMTQATWMSWLLVGFSTGGLVVAMQRAMFLVGCNPRMRRLQARLWRHHGRGGRVSRALSSGCWCGALETGGPSS